MPALIEAQNIQHLRSRDLKIDNRLFVLAIDVAQKKPLAVTVAKTNTGEVLYAVPGGERWTESEIRKAIKEGAL